MLSFGAKIADLRKRKKMSQDDLADILNTSKSLVSKYERDLTVPSIDVAKRLAKILHTSASYLLDDDSDSDVLKDESMMRRLKDLDRLSDDDKEKILFTFDGLLRDAKARMAYSS